MTIAQSAEYRKTRAMLLDGTSPDGGPDKETIFLVQEKLYGLASFTKLQKDSKKLARRKTQKQRSIARGANYGVYPEGELMILDIDVKDAKSPAHARTLLERQLDVLSTFFDIPLRETLSVITPTGGAHCYVLLPEGFSFQDDAPYFPRASLGGSMSALVNTIVLEQDASQVRRRLTVDVRRSDVNTYVLGPGSWIRDKNGEVGKYNIAFDDHGFSREHIDAPILRISATGMQNMQKLSRMVEDRAASKKYAKQREAALQDQAGQEYLGTEDSYPSNRHMIALRKLIRKYPRYHSKRAAIKSALACCYSNAVIADVCMELSLNRDSSKKEPLSYDATLRDIERFIVEDPYHSVFCRNTVGKLQATGSQKHHTASISREQLQEVLKEQSQKVLQRKKQFVEQGARRREVQPAVIDVAKVRDVLMTTTNRLVMPQRVRDALDIIDYYIQPLTNYGVTQIILSRKELKNTLSLSESRVTAATRMLRDTEVLYIDTPPQPGRTTVYAVNTDMFHKDLSWALKKTWGYNNARRNAFQEVHPAALFFDRMSLGFREVFTGKLVVSPNTAVQEVFNHVDNVAEHPVRSQTGPGAALRYIRTEAIEHGVEVVPVDETTYTFIDTDSGQVLVEDWETPAVVPSMSIDTYMAKTGYTPKHENRWNAPYLHHAAEQPEQHEGVSASTPPDLSSSLHHETSIEASNAEQPELNASVITAPPAVEHSALAVVSNDTTTTRHFALYYDTASPPSIVPEDYSEQT